MSRYHGHVEVHRSAIRGPSIRIVVGFGTEDRVFDVDGAKALRDELNRLIAEAEDREIKL